MSRPQEEFLAHRRRQEAETVANTSDHDNPLRSLLTVELNTTELCNRACVFCPRVDPAIYPNRSLHLSVACAAKLAADLAGFDFRGRISFSGFGEPVLNKAFPELIRTVRARLPHSQIDTNSNGDRLTPETIARLYDAGITYIYVNMYDGPQQRPHFEGLFAAAGIDPARYRLRPHWSGPDDGYGLIINNRSGMLINPNLGARSLAAPVERPCYYPFSHAMIDWNGDLLLCSNDWGRALVIGNVLEENLADLWMSQTMLVVRRRLIAGDRRHRPCATCNVNGTLSGQYGFDLLVRHYRERGDIDEEPAGAGGDV